MQRRIALSGLIVAAAVGCRPRAALDEELVGAPGQTYPIGGSTTLADEVILELAPGDRFGTRGDDILELRLPGDFAATCQLDRSTLVVRFERDADALRGSIERIDAVAECLTRRFVDARVVVLAPALGDALGRQRARRVADALTGAGVPSTRLSTR